MKKKTIILGNDGNYGLLDEIIINLELLGFNVIVIKPNNSFVFNNRFQRLLNFLNKKIFKSKEIEKRLKLEPQLNDFYSKLDNIESKVDYALFIRVDDFPISFLKEINAISHTMVAYQWDGLKLFPDAIKRIKYFDRFFVFDPYDLCVDDKLLPATNFYFKIENINKINKLKNVYFFGTFIKYRMDIIAKLSYKMKILGFIPDINIVVNKKDNLDAYRNSEINFLRNKISFRENSINTYNAEVLIDVVNGKHNGLSFRIFEAIGYEKKLITTNVEVKKYEFYHPNNIFILTEHNLDNLEDFLSKPYQDIGIELKLKYSFNNWINYILGINPHHEIKLPI